MSLLDRLDIVRKKLDVELTGFEDKTVDLFSKI